MMLYEHAHAGIVQCLLFVLKYHYDYKRRHHIQHMLIIMFSVTASNCQHARYLQGVLIASVYFTTNPPPCPFSTRHAYSHSW